MAARLISEGAGDLIAFGRDYIANPDLAERIRLDAPLNEPRPEYFYGSSATGYTDYPTAVAEPTDSGEKQCHNSAAPGPLEFYKSRFEIENNLTRNILKAIPPGQTRLSAA